MQDRSVSIAQPNTVGVGRPPRRGKAKRRPSPPTRPKAYVLPSGKAVRVRPGSCLDVAFELAGCIRTGPPDFSTNPKYLAGLGRD